MTPPSDNVTGRRIALVTGANRGLGREVARSLAIKDCLVWLGARDLAQGEAAAAELSMAGLSVSAVQLDVTDQSSVDSAVALLTKECGRLDILVNNAGVALDVGVKPSSSDVARIRSMFEVNLLGCIRVTQAFTPLLRRSTEGRIVMVSSDIGSHGHQTNPDFPYYDLNPLGYGASKAALNAATIAFAKEFRDTRIKVNAANPGFTATDLNRFRGKLTVEEGAAPIVTLATLPDDGPTCSFLGPDGEEPW